jgi:hypothetical protein
MMEALNISETTVNICQTTRRNIPEDSYLHTRRRENLICIQCTSHTLYLIAILILSFCLHLGLPRGLFPSSVLSKILYAFVIFSMRATCRARLILKLITLIMFGEEYKLRRSSECNYFQPVLLIGVLVFSCFIFIKLLYGVTESVPRIGWLNNTAHVWKWKRLSMSGGV